MESTTSEKQHLFKWEDCQLTWKDNMTLKQAFPEFNLEDKVSFKEEGNVTNIATTKEIVENSGNKKKGHVGSNERKRWSARAKITNSKLANFEWSKVDNGERENGERLYCFSFCSIF